MGTDRALVSGRRPERAILIYWLLATTIGIVFLWDWLTAWNVQATLGNPWLVFYLCCSFALSQVMYVLVARHDGRPLHLGSLVMFAIGNGIAETLAFAAVYRAGEILGAGLFGLFAPGLAAPAGFVVGLIAFIIYGGLIHALFWMPVLPPHLDNAPRAKKIRRLRPLAEVALVLGWSLVFWLYRDIWTIVGLHILVDVGLILLVRPSIFRGRV